MIKRTYEELEPYFPPGHFGVTCKRYHGKDETGASKFWIGVSEFEPDGGADWDGYIASQNGGEPAKLTGYSFSLGEDGFTLLDWR